MRRSLLAGLAVLAFGLAGCGLVGSPGSSIDGDWQLTSGTSAGARIPIVSPGSITMRIKEGTIGGRSACNTYGGTIAVHGDRVAISALSMTEMACAEALMSSEAAYLGALPRVTRFARDGGDLVLSGPGVALHYTLASG